MPTEVCVNMLTTQKLNISLPFFNVNISVTIKIRHLIFSVIILRFFIFCLVYILCNIENIVENNVKKFPVFCHKIKTRT